MNKATKQQFLTVIESAIAEAERVIQDAQTKSISWLEEDSKIAKDNFEKIKEQVLANTLPKSEGAGLGITRGLSEMVAPDSLYRAGKELEDYYMSNWS